MFHQLQSAIVRGELAPGSKITEPGLSKTYGISRGPLREAMRFTNRWRMPLLFLVSGGAIMLAIDVMLIICYFGLTFQAARQRED